MYPVLETNSGTVNWKESLPSVWEPLGPWGTGDHLTVKLVTSAVETTSQVSDSECSVELASRTTGRAVAVEYTYSTYESD